MWSVVTKCTYFVPHLHVCSDWLITKKLNIQSFVWATVMKLGMWAMVNTSTTHVVCHHQMCLFNISFAYLFWLDWLANNIQSCVWAIVTKLGMLVVVDTSTTHLVCHHQMGKFNTSFAYLFWLAYKKKGKYLEFCIGYSDETFYLSNSTQRMQKKYY